MKPMLMITTRIRQATAAFSGLLARRWKANFYLYLAGVFTAFILLDATVLHVAGNMRQVTFDAMVRYRIVKPQPDPDIVIVDINEASLAAMAKDYGRWPWPRQVLGEFLENLEKQQPKAVVFDILFSDADVYNPDSDAYFDAAIADTHNTFFPMLRLDPASDSLSQIKPGMIPGVTPMPGEQADPDATVGIVLPHFQAALDGGRLGLHNIYPDIDGVARRYDVYRDDYGWRLPSLPARIAQEEGWKLPKAQQVLLNWRGKPFTYHYVSFSDVYADMTSKNKTRPQDEFRNKIVLIGSTAPSLFDIKATPVSRMFPGVEILATAIDNLKHGDALRFPEGKFWYPLLTLAIVWLTALAFYRDAGRDKIDRLFGLSQFILLGVSYASINFTNTYINLTGPVTVGLAFFSLARIYSGATHKALERNMVRAAAERVGELRATLLLIRFDTQHQVVPDAVLRKIRLGLARVGQLPKSVEMLNGEQKGLWDLFEKTIAVSWVTEAADAEAEAAVQRDAQAVLAALQPMLRKNFAAGEQVVSHHLHEGLIRGGEAARAGWRVVFAEALLEWDRRQEQST